MGAIIYNFRWWLVLNLICTIPYLLSAQEVATYHVQHYSTANGLSNNWVSAITEDAQGYLWLATQYGANRFDGQHFRAYTYEADQEKGLSGNWVRSLSLAPDSTLWLGSHGGGIARLRPSSNQYETRVAENVLKKASVFSILHTAEGNCSLGTGRGLYRIHKNGAIRQFMAEKVIHQITGWRDSSLLVLSSEGGLSLLERNSLSGNTLMDEVDAFLPLNADSILVFRSGELAIIQSVVKEREMISLSVQTPSHPQSFYHPIMYQCKGGDIWVGGTGGLWRFSADLRERHWIDLRDILPYQTTTLPSLHCLYEDRNGILWLGTDQGVLQLTPTLPFRHQKLAIAGHFPNIRTMVAKDGHHYLADLDSLYYWSPALAAPVTVTEGAFTSLIATPAGQFYGVGYYQDRLELVVLTADRPPKKINSISIGHNSSWLRLQVDKRGRLWMSNWTRLVCWDPATQQSFQHALIDNNGDSLRLELTDLLVDKQDRLWLASLSLGVLRVDDISTMEALSYLSYQHYQHDVEHPTSITTDLAQALHEDAAGRIWVGTDGGLNLYDDATETFRRWLRSEQMPDDKILDIVDDEQGRLWCSTASHGLLAFDVDNGVFYNFTEKDGLYSNDMLIGSAYAEENGRLWMGSAAGLNVFTPTEILQTSAPVDTLIWQSIHYYQADAAWQQAFPTTGRYNHDPVLIHASDHSVQLSFAWLNFQFAGQQHYQYQLQPLHTQWLPMAADGRLTLAQLPAGRYILQLKAQAHNNSQHAVSRTIHLKVLPPWYRSTLAFLIYVLSLGGLVLYLYRTQLARRLAIAERAQAEELVHSKLRFFRRIAHEFRSPLTLVFAAVAQMKKRLPTDVQSQVGPQLEQLERQADHLTGQVEEILELAKLQAAGASLTLTTVDFVQYQQFLLQSFASVAETKGISLNFDANPERAYFPFDTEKWRKITSNLMSNALKFTPPGGAIYLQLRLIETVNKTSLHFKLLDTGPGMDPAFVPHAFEPFAQEGSMVGSGIGLALTKALVELHGGSIEIESKLGHGTTFHIKVPIDLQPVISKSTIEDRAGVEQPLILIAEDHAELRAYLNDCLSSDYRLRLVANGAEAWAVCLEELPDLIISDVMMPGGSGLELSQRIRANERTNHIPLILLTGKSGQSARLAGLRAGADVYLTKPFHQEELLLRIDGLLAARRRLQAKYQAGDFTIARTSVSTDTFMQRVVDVLKAELDNEDLSVEMLAAQLHLSRVQLFRKLKALTGQTPSLFIRQIRLQHGQKLLLESDQTVAEIAYTCGFKDPAYFARVYREVFGYSPSKERERDDL